MRGQITGEQILALADDERMKMELERVFMLANENLRQAKESVRARSWPDWHDAVDVRLIEQLEGTA